MGEAVTERAMLALADDWENDARIREAEADPAVRAKVKMCADVLRACAQDVRARLRAAKSEPGIGL